jgi:hypothetical protein
MASAPVNHTTAHKVRVFIEFLSSERPEDRGEDGEWKMED